LCIARKTAGIEQRYDKVILFHDNARPHVAKIVKKYLETLKWDFITSAVLLLRTLLLLITGCSEGCSTIWQVHFFHQFTSFAEIENWLQNWIASKDESFFRDGIRKLPERWEKVGSDGYFN